MKDQMLKKLQTARAALATAIENAGANQAELQKLERQREKLETELAKVNSAVEADPTNESAVGRQPVLQKQLELLRDKIREVEHAGISEADDHRAMLSEAMELVSAAITAALEPQAQSLAQRAAAAIRPFFKTDEATERAAEKTDAVRSARAFITNCCRLGPSPSEPQRILGVLDALLAGKSPWSWPAPANA